MQYSDWGVATKVTCVYTLENLHEAFEQMNTKHQDDGTNIKSQDFAKLIEAIHVALRRFDATSDCAILRAYRQDGARRTFQASNNTDSPIVKQEEKGAGQGPTSTTQEHEIVFLVYL